MSISSVMLFTFIGVTFSIVSIGWIVYDLFFSVRHRADDRLKDVFSDEMRSRTNTSPLLRELNNPNAGFTFNSRLLATRFTTWLEQSGSQLSPRDFALSSLCLAAIGGGGIYYLTNSFFLAPLGMIAGALPAACICHRRLQRTEMLTQQLPEAFSAISRALRAGQGLPTAIQMVANDFPKPLSEEFTHYYEQQHLGVANEVALRDMVRRVDVMELRIFAVALIVQQRAGGNLADLLKKLADLIRKRVKMRRRVKALTGEGRMQAVVLIAMPVLVLAALALVAPEYSSVLWEHYEILVGCAISQCIGAFLISRIVNIDY
ncbi:type II secretion system F family protein [Blastopirellula sp. J2-11]|uniref:type II secretion system F family protein n=1 Tax=Blastopirellula sp. J2-11 TaxID=2943192 RepID=UPI0021C8DC6F|nr:type II secretion system F family protein [Blastopirellula sp. J2-11]UUO07230.1 type II secretion system F family protein [Blastopirellula sp. J2-11]